MLAIRMQRTGRKGHAMYRMVVQDARRTPTSGKIVAYLGSYDPHAKLASVDKAKADFYLEHGAQPSPRASSILKAEKIKLPDWVAEPKSRKGAVRNPDKRRSTTPVVEAPAVEAEVTPPVEENVTTEASEATPEPVVEANVATAEVETEETTEKPASDPSEPDA